MRSVKSTGVVELGPIDVGGQSFGLCVKGGLAAAQPKEVPFADLTIEKAKVKFRTRSSPSDSFEVRGEFTLGTGNDGINLNENEDDVVITVGPASVTIPAGSFVAVGSKLRFKGVIPDTEVKVKMQLKETDPGVFKFKIKVKGVDLAGTANPVSMLKEIINNGSSSTTSGCAFNPDLTRLYTANFSVGEVVVHDNVHPHNVTQVLVIT